ncbi:hypothetical protein B0I35DRAFT_449606 [Stachybotrys elegans]|uniref:Levodione reductase n=1 Tax=Stachybotrys elegans TaxID=80388 RepID=A0A8K0WTY0_9HYPO|nr:hypothetical protein B0I35DRAFT_449606 [Stachybotrys elegans]
MATPYPFQDKVVTITGASRGVGLALAKYLLVRGATISISSSNADNIAAAAAELEKDFPDAKDRILSAAVNTKDLSAVAKWITDTVARFGKIDACANVAGREQRKLRPITAMDLDDWEDLLATNLTGTFHCLREEMKVISEGGSIVNVGSVASSYASAGVAGYITSKHGLIGLTKVAAFEAAPRNVRVNAICPGSINTSMMQTPFDIGEGKTWELTADNVPQLFKRFSEPEEIAAGIAFLLGDESKFVTKSSWFMDGGWMEGSFSG